MKSKLYFGVLIVLFAVLGRYIEITVVPNQQIVVQFSDSQIPNSNTHDAIEAIKLKLQTFGAKHIKVGKDLSGQLKITYYSNSRVEQIKKVLSADEDLKFAYDSVNNSTQFPEQDKRKDYELNISEIQKSGHYNNWGVEGVEVVELRQKSDRFNTLKLPFGASIYIEGLVQNVVVYKAFYNNLTIADKHAYKIPKVRAGPLAQGVII